MPETMPRAEVSMIPEPMDAETLQPVTLEGVSALRDVAEVLVTGRKQVQEEMAQAIADGVFDGHGVKQSVVSRSPSSARKQQSEPVRESGRGAGARRPMSGIMEEAMVESMQAVAGERAGGVMVRPASMGEESTSVRIARILSERARREAQGVPEHQDARPDPEMTPATTQEQQRSEISMADSKAQVFEAEQLAAFIAGEQEKAAPAAAPPEAQEALPFQDVGTLLSVVDTGLQESEPTETGKETLRRRVEEARNGGNGSTPANEADRVAKRKKQVLSVPETLLNDSPTPQPARKAGARPDMPQRARVVPFTTVETVRKRSHSVQRYRGFRGLAESPYRAEDDIRMALTGRSAYDELGNLVKESLPAKGRGKPLATDSSDAVEEAETAVEKVAVEEVPQQATPTVEAEPAQAETVAPETPAVKVVRPAPGSGAVNITRRLHPYEREEIVEAPPVVEEMSADSEPVADVQRAAEEAVEAVAKPQGAEELVVSEPAVKAAEAPVVDEGLIHVAMPEVTPPETPFIRNEAAAYTATTLEGAREVAEEVVESLTQVVSEATTTGEEAAAVEQPQEAQQDDTALARTVTSVSGSYWEVPVESVSMGMFNLLGDMVGGVVEVSERGGRRIAESARSLTNRQPTDVVEHEVQGPLVSRMARRVTGGARGMMSGAAQVVRGGGDVVVGSLGCVVGSVTYMSHYLTKERVKGADSSGRKAASETVLEARNLTNP
ncbi:MAG: hypothetical protein HQL50_07695 [Magnetococcales bacterium]|nr:hypothetical protein [Magnetococcales bacterium]